MMWNRRCWDRAVLGELEAAALADCNEAVRLDPNVAAIVDSRAFTYLKMRQWDSAIADFTIRPCATIRRWLPRSTAAVSAGSTRATEAAAMPTSRPAEEFAHYGVQ